MAVVSHARRIEGAGTSEADWLAWPGLAKAAPLDLEQWLPAEARLVVVAPHPDDEVLACGGLLALHAARGGACLVVAVTDGEASHAGSPDWPACRLSAARRAESEAGSVELGLHEARFTRLGLPDGGVAAHADQLATRLKGLLRDADRLVTTWRLDGHPDHEATGLAVARACAAVGCALAEAPVWMWHWAVPDDPRVPWHRLRTLALPRPMGERKRRALAAHVTQLMPRRGGQAPVLGAAILERLARPTECFFV